LPLQEHIPGAEISAALPAVATGDIAAAYAAAGADGAGARCPMHLPSAAIHFRCCPR